MNNSKFKLLGICLFLCVAMIGCGDSDDGHIRKSKSIEGAADHLSDAFQGADGESLKNAGIASAAIKKGQFQKALYAIETIKAKPDVSFDQGVAINDSLINLERELIYRVEDGDPKAIAAYELLKRINRN
ncbi:hypothetical protein OAG52_03540 [Verrucomicrobia bacterium]|jgi:hypothetical protein|nr:hypothetical protein [Verrucomicrobiota bacterium]